MSNNKTVANYTALIGAIHTLNNNPTTSITKESRHVSGRSEVNSSNFAKKRKKRNKMSAQSRRRNR